jgi:hypothetical protein
LSKPVDEQLAQELGPTLGPVIQALGDYICRRMQMRAANDRGGWIDQHHSQLSPRRHCRAVRDRIEKFKENPEASGAKKVGDRYLLTVEAMEQEMARPRVAKTQAIDPEMVAAERVKHLLGGK